MKRPKKEDYKYYKVGRDRSNEMDSKGINIATYSKAQDEFIDYIKTLNKESEKEMQDYVDYLESEILKQDKHIKTLSNSIKAYQIAHEDDN